jgi:hypothetical protein
LCGDQSIVLGFLKGKSDSMQYKEMGQGPTQPWKGNYKALYRPF